MDDRLPPTHTMDVRVTNSGRVYYRTRWGGWAFLMRDTDYNDKALREKNVKGSSLKEIGE